MRRRSKPIPVITVHVVRHHGKPGRAEHGVIKLVPDKAAVVPAGIRISGSEVALHDMVESGKPKLYGTHVIICIPPESLADMVRAAADYALEKTLARQDRQVV